ncbi:MAG: TIGR03621 family F420-dependent LLM class oxidoreductase [Actinobacteria bacterium]|nr:TIGR03621 family F420-dependent LLM class oxidoreductase [Actinomycetota bacterium]
MALRPFRFTVQASHLGAPEDLLPLARRAEDLGVSVLTVADHVTGEEVAPLTALMAAASATSELRVGSLVLSNDYRHPVLLAREAATIDRLSGGRLEFGIGAGWMTVDYTTTGIHLDPPSRRIERLDEALDVIEGTWSAQPFSYDGEHYQVHDLDARPAPAQSPRPPIVIGGGGRRILELAGRRADIVHLNPRLTAGVIDERAGASATEAATVEKIDWIKAAAGQRFDDLEIGVRIHLAIITDARDELYETMAGGFGLTPEEARRSPHALGGTVEQIVDDLLERRELLGISAIGLSASSLGDMAPVIAALAGT